MGFILIPGNAFVSVAKLCKKTSLPAGPAVADLHCNKGQHGSFLPVASESLLLFDLSKPFFLNICWQMYALKIFEDFQRLQVQQADKINHQTVGFTPPSTAGGPIASSDINTRGR